VGRFWWTFFFALVPVVALGWTWYGAYPVSDGGPGWWFNAPSGSSIGKEIDDLFYLLTTIVTVIFFGTHIALVYVVWRFHESRNDKSWFSHGSHALEVLWTIAPAGILLFISLYQMDVWGRYRMISTFDKEAVAHPIAEVTARQFEWRIRYPHPSRKFANKAEVEAWLARPEPDDLHTVNDLHVPTGKPVVIHLRTQDVLHSFFIPDLRVKQDAVPGLVIPVWFDAEKSGTHDLVCAELCGWGHYKMRGQISAQNESDFEQYLKDLEARQNDDGTKSESSEDEVASAQEGN